MKYIILNDRFEEIGKADNLAGIQSIIGISRKQFYNLRQKNAYKITYKGNTFHIIDTPAMAWYMKMERILVQMEDADIMLHNINLN
jgi:hypothetical protein